MSDLEAFADWLEGRADEISAMFDTLERPTDYAQGKIDAFREAAWRARREVTSSPATGRRP